MLVMRLLIISNNSPNPSSEKLSDALKAIRPGKPYDPCGVRSVTNNWSSPVLMWNKNCNSVVSPISVVSSDNIKYSIVLNLVDWYRKSSKALPNKIKHKPALNLMTDITGIKVSRSGILNIQSVITKMPAIIVSRLMVVIILLCDGRFIKNTFVFNPECVIRSWHSI